MSARTTIAALGAVAFVVGSVTSATAARAEPVAPAAANSAATLALVNGWTNSPFDTGVAAISTANGIATFRGAISTSGTSNAPFVLPPAFRPTANVYLSVDMCGGTHGRLVIEPTGDAIVQAETDPANARCFTSLEGVSYPVASAGYTTLGLVNGWTGAPFTTRSPAVKNVDGIVHFKGAMSTSQTSNSPFRLPAAFRPAQAVYLKLNLCNATNGRLVIQSNGTVSVAAESDFANAQCFTSLEGVSYDLTGSPSFPVTPLNGWVASPFSTRTTSASLVSNVVHLRGAVSTSGTDSTAFRLRADLRPNRTVYVPVDMCNATNGRVIIQKSGYVFVEAQSNFANAQCFTSLEGVDFRVR